ncbi:helix-turn-helix transcriptional regulator [Vibrio sp. SCSIO 43137]|uniref:helix-turn-helix transcriptional regulator n=1 Tax=Vibrio sp. SCSIO 43137 TaxID=3021011 RepID=UPI002306FC0F|nr:helix-turn-helix domain-containing protein [Vibrio sp. SCSIO 43137]WCE32677.1 helix-turn-helix domain-containing protein [Vibrio sp. SCSIO 43137]
MNLPRNKYWQQEAGEIAFDGAELVSFDIWGGLRSEDRAQGKFRGEDFRYMTLMYSTKEVPLEYVWSCPPPFLSRNDNNVERLLSAKSPILHNHSLIDKQQQKSLDKFIRRFNFADEKGYTVLVPVDSCVENRWRASLCFSFTLEDNYNPNQFLSRCQEALITLANKIYKWWLVFEDKGFNLYQVRKTFCSNAINIARMLAEGCSTKVMADKLNISRSGVEYHIESMRQILGASNRGNLIAELFRKGIVQ